MEARAKSYVGVGAGTGAGALLHCVAVIGAGAGMLVSMVSSGKALARAATKGRRAKRINSLASRRGGCGLRLGRRCEGRAWYGCWASILGTCAWNPLFRYRRARGRRWWSGEMLVGSGRHDAETRASTEEGRIFAAAYHRLLASPSTFISVIGQCARYQCWGKIRTWCEAAEACWVSPALGVL